MSTLLERLRALLFGGKNRHRARAIRNECATLKRWSKRSSEDRYTH